MTGFEFVLWIALAFVAVGIVAEIGRYLFERQVAMSDTEKTALASAYALLEQSLATYKDVKAISDEAIEMAALGRQETIVIDLYLRLMKELEK